MSIEIKVPSLGDGVETADVLEILVSEGDAIEKDQGIVELETDKATAVVPATDAGTVTKVHVGEGDTVPVGAVLLTVESTSAATTPPASAPEPTPAAAEVAPEPVAATPAPEPPVTPAPPAQVAAPTNPPVEPAPIVAPPAGPIFWFRFGIRRAIGGRA